MTSLDDHLDQYLKVRRQFGCKLTTEEPLLRRFVAFANSRNSKHITSDLFLKWKEKFGSANNNTWSRRLGIVRIFAAWLKTIDSRHDVPPAGLIVGKLHRPRPFIYTDEQIAEIVATAALLPSVYGLRGLTCSTLFGLIAVTGLRISEAIGLEDDDVDLEETILTVRQGKHGKSRFIPVANSVAEQLASYRSERNRVVRSSKNAFFLIENGHQLTDCGLRYNFARVCQRIGLRKEQPFGKHGRGPRIHDLRHTFAVRTIISWYRNGLDPDREMTKLSTYLGHLNPDHTYWYIEAVPELLQLASQRADQSLFGEEQQ